MMKLNSREVLIFSLVVLVVLLGGLLVFGLLWGFGSMMGLGVMGPGMMGGVGLFWLLLLCLPLLLLIFILAGAVWLIATRGENQSARGEKNCPNCGRSIRSDWQVCPYCGETLKVKSDQ